MTLVELEDALWGYHQNNGIQAHFTAMQIRAWGGKVTGKDLYMSPFDETIKRLDLSTEEGKKEVDETIKNIKW